MTNIYLIRHGETDWNKNLQVQGQVDIELNETGLRQANENSVYLKDLKIDKIVSSPLSRAYETAKIFKDNNNIDLDISIDEGIIERSFGALEGTNAKEMRALKNPHDYEGYETNEELQKRIDQVIEKYLNSDFNDVAIFSHSHVLKSALINYEEGLDFSDFFLPNCAILKLMFDENKYIGYELLNCEIVRYN